MKFLIYSLLVAGVACVHAQNFNTATIVPTPTASSVGSLRFAEKSNSSSRHTLSLQGPDSLSGNVIYKFAGSTSAGCLLLSAASGGVNTVSSGSCSVFPIVIPSGTAAPQIDATGLAAALNINGSSTGNGDIVLNPGNVVSNASVAINAARTDQPALYLVNPAGVTTSTIFEIRNNSNAAKIWVMQSGDATCPNCLNTQTILPTADNTYDLGQIGSSAERWTHVYAENVMLSGLGTVPGSGAAEGLYLGHTSGSSWAWGMDSGSGTVLYTGVKSSTASANAYTLYTNSGSNGQMLITATQDIVISTPSFTIPFVTSYNGDNTAGFGLPPIVYHASGTNDNAGHSGVNITVNGGTVPAGAYMIQAMAQTHTAGTAGSSVTFTTNWNAPPLTSPSGINLDTSSVTLTSWQNWFTNIIADGTHNVTYTWGYSGTGTYDWDLSLIRIN